MKKRIFSLMFIITSFFMLYSCAKKTTVTTVIPVTPTNPVTSLITLPIGWKMSTSFGTSFPPGIQVYQYDTIFLGKRVKAFCVAYDSKNTAIEFKPIMASTATTPSTFSSNESGVVYACINGGYFGSNQSFSLVKYNNVVSSANIKAVTRTFNGVNTSYYPTRAAFGVDASGTPSIGWIYNVGTGNDLIYNYPSPSPNLLGSAPQPVPTATFPANGTIWNTTSAIGGSPVLIKNNSIQITANEELIDVNNTTSRPRSAIGYTNNGIVLILAVEGDNSPTYTGINLADLAALQQSLGATNAINLDGGGSTSLIIGGLRTVRPGDNGVERPVVSAILIKKK
jgi:hypothetical protein